MEFKTFEELFAVPLRNGLTKPKKVRGNGYKMVNMGELFKYSRMNNIPMDRVPLTEKEKESSLLESDDLLFARQSLVRDGAGQCSIFLGDNEAVCFESHLIRCRLNKKIANPVFYFYFFMSKLGKQTIDAIIEQGAGAAGIRGKDLSKLLVPYLDKPLQDEIAEQINTLDDKIELNRQINQTLEQIAQTIFKSWFVDFEPVKAKIAAKAAGHNPERAAKCAISGKTDAELDQLTEEQRQQLAATAALFPDKLVESELGLVPEGWEVKQIKEVVKRYSVGKKYSQKTSAETGNVPILDQGKSGVIGFHSNDPGVKASPDDPIIVFANHTCYMRLVMHDFSTIQNVLPFKGTHLNVFWLYCATIGKQNFIEYKGHWPDFEINRIVVPSYELCQVYGDYIREYFFEIFLNENEITTLANIRESLLPELLTGKFLTCDEITLEETAHE